MSPRAKNYLIISGVFLLSTLILYSYFWFFHPQKLQWVYQNWDGPSYVVIAKSLYNQDIAIKVNNIPVVGSGYFAAHFPLYPIFIRIFSFIGYYRSMLFVNHLMALGVLLVFYELVSRFKFTKSPLLLTLAFVLFPPRWFLLTNVGSSEATFMFFSLLMLYFFLKRKHWPAALAGSLAQLTRFQAVHWLLAIGIIAIIRLAKREKIIKIIKEYYPYLLMPLSLILLFSYFYLQFNNFWQFFAIQKGFSQAHWPPFKLFVSNQTLGIQTFWLEGYALVYITYLAGILSLWFNKKNLQLLIFGLSYFIPYIFWVHMDLSRLLVPLFPFVLIGAEKVFSNKAVVIAIYLLYPATMAHFIGFTAWNLAP